VNSERLNPPELLEEQLAELATLVEARLGLSFQGERRADLARGTVAAMKALQFRDATRYIRWLRESAPAPGQLDELVTHLAVGETYFFRDPASFEALRTHVLPELVRARQSHAGSERSLRIWSAGCSTGEEAYSLAIVLELAIADLDRWDVTLLATDINRQALQAAERGVYREWSFRGVPEDMRRRFFRARPDGLTEVVPHVRRRVKFAYLNLGEDAYPSGLNNTNAMDLIVCRNVLMYFTPERAAQVLGRLERSLGDGGWLALASAEFGMPWRPAQLSSVRLADAAFLRKAAFDPSASGAARPEVERAVLALATPGETCPGPPLANANATAATENVSFDHALALYRAGRYESAADAARAMLARHPGNAVAMALLARIHANLGRLDAALEWSRGALDAEKLDPVTHYVHAGILLDLGRPSEAVVSLERALFLDQDFTLAHYTLGMLARAEGRAARARRHLRNALASLDGRGSNEEVAQGEGMTAGRLTAIIGSMSELTQSGG
jgi:chemotaxis protein methyltransferase CheR